MPILKYNPFNDENTNLRAFEDAVNRLWNEPGVRPWTPPVDIVETENELVLKADVPNVALKDIDIRLENNTLTIKGERRFEEAKNSKGYHRIERSYGAFARSFALPETIETERVSADYKDGVLTITLPKKEVAKPRTIKVEVSNN